MIGWVAESWLGRYRAIVTGLLLTTVAIAEEHYERYFDQEEKYMREADTNCGEYSAN